MTGTAFAALFDHAGIGIVNVDAGGKIIAINKLALAQFGYEEGELIHEKVEQLIPHRYRDRHILHRNRYGLNPTNRIMGSGIELTALRKDGSEFPAEIALGYSAHEEDNTVFVFVNDITRRKEAEAILKQENAGLERRVTEHTAVLTATIEQLNRQVTENERKDEILTKTLAREKELSELKSRFVSFASHEFRTPLASIAASAYLLSKYVTGEEQPLRDKHITRILASIESMKEILDDFLSVDRIEEGKVLPQRSLFNISAFVRSLTDDMRPVLRKGHSLVYNHSGPDADVYFDQSMMRHVLTNLLSNAIKYSPDGSPVEIATERGENQLTIRVTDHGIGIPAGDQEHLFRRFFRASNAGHLPGTGLGLMIVKKYTELMGGNITFVSEAGKGTTFTLIFLLEAIPEEETTTVLRDSGLITG